MGGSTVFAERLRFLREKGGISQGDLAKELGVSRGAISFYENGDRTPNIDFLCDVATYFSVPVEYMLGLRDNYRNDDVNDDLFFLSDAAIDNLYDCAEYGELLSAVLEHEDFISFFHQFKDFADIERIKMQRYMENGDFKEVDILEDPVRGLIDKEYLIYRMTRDLLNILRKAAIRYTSKGIDEKKCAALERIQMESSQKDAEETARLSEIYRKELETRMRVLERIHGQKEGD